jgi:hypothetical protein
MDLNILIAPLSGLTASPYNQRSEISRRHSISYVKT